MLHWIDSENYIYCNRVKYNKSDKLACFDIDGTIITTRSGKTHAGDDLDWKFAFPGIKGKLQQLINNNFKIIFITNQRGLNNSSKISIWKTKIFHVLKKLKLLDKITVFVSIKYDYFSKPLTGFFDEFIPEFDKLKSFYCGDAAGRLTDFANTDYEFAVNLGIPFYTPDKYFNNQPTEKLPRLLHPCNNYHKLKVSFDIPAEKCMIINVGSPCSGKSCFTNKYLKPLGFKIINQDELKTLTKCIRACEDLLKKNKNIVIDNTNGKLDIRKKWIDLATRYKYHIVCCVYRTPQEIIKHNNGYRNYVSRGKIKLIPEVVFRTYNKHYVEPTKTEGFSKIVEIPFGIIDKKNKKYLTNFFY